MRLLLDITIATQLCYIKCSFTPTLTHYTHTHTHTPHTHTHTTHTHSLTQAKAFAADPSAFAALVQEVKPEEEAPKVREEEGRQQTYCLRRVFGIETI